MAKFTFETRLKAGLLALGWSPTPSRSKYTVFRAPLYVGANGALRCGATVSDSWSVGCPASPGHEFYAGVLRRGDAELVEARAVAELRSALRALRDADADAPCAVLAAGAGWTGGML